MRKSITQAVRMGLVAFFATAMMATVSSAAEAAENPLLLFVDGRQVELSPPPMIVKDRTLIPVRGFFEFLGAEVTWDADNQAVTVSGNNTTVRLEINNPIAMVDGREVKMDVPPQIADGRTIVPLRFVSESIGADVTWAHPDTILVRSTRSVVSRSGSRRDAPRAGEAIVTTARQYLDYPYAWGGTSPSVGFDCSGFTKFVAGQVGISLPRTSQEQATVGVKVSRSELLAGDLVFFETYAPGPTHAGIYLGDGKFISAKNETTGVHIDPMSSPYWGSRFLYGRRIVR